MLRCCGGMWRPLTQKPSRQAQQNARAGKGWKRRCCVSSHQRERPHDMFSYHKGAVSGASQCCEHVGVRGRWMLYRCCECLASGPRDWPHNLRFSFALSGSEVKAKLIYSSFSVAAIEPAVWFFAEANKAPPSMQNNSLPPLALKTLGCKSQGRPFPVLEFHNRTEQHCMLAAPREGDALLD